MKGLTGLYATFSEIRAKGIESQTIGKQYIHVHKQNGQRDKTKKYKLERGLILDANVSFYIRAYCISCQMVI